MKNQLQTLFFIFILPFISPAQGELESVVFNGQTFYELSGLYYILDNSEQTLIPVSSKVISLKFNSELENNQIEAFEDQFNLSFTRKAPSGWRDYQLNSTADLFEQCNAIQNSTLVEEVEVSSVVQFQKIPNDSAGYHNPSQQWYAWGIPVSKVDKAWDKTTGNPSIIIGVIDSGVDWWHQDFAQATGTAGTFWLNTDEDAWANPNVPGGNGIDDDNNGFVDDWRGWDFLSNSNDVSDDSASINSHGTGVTGIFAARTNNFIGVAGVAGGWGSVDGVKAMPIKIGEIGESDPVYSNNLDDAIYYAANNGAHIINMSLRVFSNYSSIEDAIEFAYRDSNCVLVAGSGNYIGRNFPVDFPARHPLVISAGSTNDQDHTVNCATGPNLDLGAPGISLPHVAPNNQYQVNGATSTATPWVSGIAGLMLSINPCLINEEVRNILIRRADQVHKNNPYDYMHDLATPGHSNLMGYGRVNAQTAVNTAEAMKENTLDLYIKDHYEDFGYPNSYPATTFYSDWSDIWVRNQPDGYTNRTMDEIKYVQGKNVYVYVRVRNKSCVASTPDDSLKVYWTKFSSSSSWPANWNGSQPNIGDKIAEIPLPPLAAGEDTILEFPWTIIADADHWGRCIMARIASSSDPITPYSDLGQQIRYNNNIAIRNLTVIHTKSGQVGPVVGGVQFPDGVYGFVGLPDDGTVEPVDIHLDVPFDFSGATLVEDAEVRLFLSDDLWDIFQGTQPSDREGIEIVGDKELLVTSNHASIRNLEFQTAQRCSLYIGFNFLTEEVGSTSLYRYHLTQYRNEILDGGMHLTIDRSERDDFEADAGPDQYIYEGESAQMSASDISEPATYNWYDANDSLIYSGKSPTLSPAYTEKYKLEVIANADLYKDYDEVEIKVNPYAINSLNPNPATSNLNIDYDADEASSAYIMIYPTVGSTGNSYIISTTQNQTSINVSSYTAGVYTVILVCDGIIADSKMLTIQ